MLEAGFRKSVHVLQQKHKTFWKQLTHSFVYIQSLNKHDGQGLIQMYQL